MAKSKIKRVTESPSKYFNGKVYGVIYNSKSCLYCEAELPNTVKRFIEKATVHRERPVYEYKGIKDGKAVSELQYIEIIHEFAEQQ